MYDGAGLEGVIRGGLHSVTPKNPEGTYAVMDILASAPSGHSNTGAYQLRYTDCRLRFRIETREGMEAAADAAKAVLSVFDNKDLVISDGEILSMRLVSDIAVRNPDPAYSSHVRYELVFSLLVRSNL